jgi:hypothetical protein
MFRGGGRGQYLVAVVIAAVDSLEPAPVERHDSSREQVEIAAQDDEL